MLSFGLYPIIKSLPLPHWWILSFGESLKMGIRCEPGAVPAAVNPLKSSCTTFATVWFYATKREGQREWDKPEDLPAVVFYV